MDEARRRRPHVRRVVRHSDETRAAVLSEYATGTTEWALEKRFGISRSTIRQWAAEAGLKNGTELALNERKLLGKLLFNHIQESITTLTAQVEHMRDKTWLMQQSAEGLAVLHGVVQDKTVRLLASIQQKSLEDVRDPDGD